MGPYEGQRSCAKYNIQKKRGAIGQQLNCMTMESLAVESKYDQTFASLQQIHGEAPF